MLEIPKLFILTKKSFMPGTFSQIYIQIVFAVKNRSALVDKSWDERLYRYITAIVQGKEQKMIAINGMPDHIHIFIGMKPTCCLSDLVREIKKSSTEFINGNQLTRFRFNWQEGYAAFSYSHSQIGVVGNYIENQKEHHKSTNFQTEYKQLLESFSISYKNEYLFDWID